MKQDNLEVSVEESLDYSKLPKWMPKWFVIFTLDRLALLLKKGQWFIGLFLITLLVATAIPDGFGPGYYLVARQILFFSFCVSLLLTVFTFYKMEKGFVVPFMTTMLTRFILKDLRALGVQQAIKTIVVMCVLVGGIELWEKWRKWKSLKVN